MTAPSRRPAGFPLRLDRVSSATATSSPAARQLLRPQTAVHHSAGDLRRQCPPTGLGMDSADVRRRMAERLRAQGLRHETLLSALVEVPRHAFVDAALATQAYEDTSLPIGHGQTISKPSVVARMIEVLLHGANARAAGHLGRTLEIGTGCGYQAALLCRLSASVVSIERVRALHERARALTVALRGDRLQLVYGDGMAGHSPRAPYDSIIAAASGDAVPDAWLAQLAVGGRLVAPVAASAAGSGLATASASRQVLVVIDRRDHGFERSTHEAVQFVPLKSGAV